jgi:serine/threonine-protein kinase/endoribonuclease IRE1
LESSLLDTPTPKAKPSSILVNKNGHGQPDERKKELSINLPPSTPTPPAPNVITATPVPDGVADDGDDSDVEGEGGVPATPGKRKARRGKRGKKKKTGSVAVNASGEGVDKEDEGEKQEEKKPSSLVLTTSSPKPLVAPQPSLVVSDTILGALALQR